MSQVIEGSGSVFEFRDFYHQTIRGTPFSGKVNLKERRGSQWRDQQIRDIWRGTGPQLIPKWKGMGYDAPIMDIDMIGYDGGSPRVLMENKIGGEKPIDPSNLAVFERVSNLTGLPMLFLTWHGQFSDKGGKPAFIERVDWLLQPARRSSCPHCGGKLTYTNR